MLQRGHSGDGCVLASTLCKYDLRKGDLFVLSWARVRRVRRGSISSELLVCGGGVRSILLLPLVARCLETMCFPNLFSYQTFIIRNDATAQHIHALITIRLDLCNSILYNLPNNKIEILQRIQNQAARMLERIPRRNHITPVLRELHWLKIHDRII